MPSHEAIIIGGGISGLACARRLHEAGKELCLITDRLGGRMFAGPTAGQNFGATYITTDYHHVSSFVGRVRPLRRRDAYFASENRCVPLWHGRIWGHARALVRLLARLAEFRMHLNEFRSRCPNFCQADLLSHCPQVDRAVKQPAAEFIKENALDHLSAEFVAPVVETTLFTTPDQLNVFYYLAVLMPLLAPAYLADFSLTLDRLTAGFRQRILTETVVAVESSSRGTYRVATARHELEARNVVISTPQHNTRTFCPELEVSGSRTLMQIPIFALHVRGRRRALFQPGKIVFPRSGEPATVLLPLGPGLDLVFSKMVDPDLSSYYEEHAITACVAWKTAVQLAGDAWRPLAPRPGLFTIGDYNICGLEDSYLTGLYAANQIIGKTGSSRRGRTSG